MEFELDETTLQDLFQFAQTTYTNSTVTSEKLAAGQLMADCEWIRAYRASLPYGGKKSMTGPA